MNYIGPNFDPRNYWYLATSPTFSKIARDTDVVISTYGPEVAHYIGCKMKNFTSFNFMDCRLSRSME